METQVLLEQTNPYETHVVTLESDGRTLYLYLNSLEELNNAAHAVWVMNLGQAPSESDKDSMKDGVAPLLKKSSCDHPAGKQPFDSNLLDIVWFPEGSGVSLYHDGQVEAIIPPFSGQNAIQGYARSCIEYDSGTMPLPTSGAFHQRLQENMDFWTHRSKKESWAIYRDQMLAHFESTYGKHIQYYALSRAFPTMAIVEFQTPFENQDMGLYCSLGMGNQPMPGIEIQGADYISTARMEWVTLVPKGIDKIPGILGRMAMFPWISGNSYQNEHIYETGMELENDIFIFTDDFSFTNLPSPKKFTTQDGYPIHFMNAVNVHQETLLIAQSRGLQAALNKANIQS